MNIKKAMDRMEAANSIGNKIEWSMFKSEVEKIFKRYLELKTKSAFQAKKIKELERRLDNYRLTNE